MKTYNFHGFIGREATLRVAAKNLPMAKFEKLRFGLAFVPLTEELATALAGAGPTSAMSNEVEMLNRGAYEWAREASKRGPVVYVEAEVAAGTGWHAAVGFANGVSTSGPMRLQGREPIINALKNLGIAKDPGKDEIATLGLDAEKES
jgi:hypothetical protein